MVSLLNFGGFKMATITKLWGGLIQVDKSDSTVDLPDHDGSAAGLKLGSTLVTATAAELNKLDGATSTTSELNLNTGQTATAAEVNTACDLSAQGSLIRSKTIALTAATHGTGSEVDTSITLPASAVVLDVIVVVDTAEVTGATKTLDIGTSTVSDDPDGFVDGISVASTGIKRAGVDLTVGLNTTYVAATQTRGVLLQDSVAGSDTAGSEGLFVEKPDLTSSGAVISITSGSAFTEFAGKLIVNYIEIA